jgi:hypothetical protein
MLLAPLPPTDNEIVMHIKDRYPAGLSAHGYQYFGSADILLDRFNLATPGALIELMLEAVRHAHYPQKPCRYQSVFAWNSIDECLKFRMTHGDGANPVYELHPERAPHRGDMSIYGIAGTTASLDMRLHMYWRGETLNNPAHTPTWETVIPLPAKVGKQVA